MDETSLKTTLSWLRVLGGIHFQHSSRPSAEGRYRHVCQVDNHVQWRASRLPGAGPQQPAQCDVLRRLARDTARHANTQLAQRLVVHQAHLVARSEAARQEAVHRATAPHLTAVAAQR